MKFRRKKKQQNNGTIFFNAGSPVLIPKFAGCNPEQRTVNLRDTDDPTLFYYPSCTRVDRCGGCCSHELLTCQPKTKQYINYTV